MGIRTRVPGRTLRASATITALACAALLGAAGPAAVAAGNPATLSCVLAPGTLNISATVTLDSGAVVAPASVAPGGTFSVTLTPTVTVPAAVASDLSSLGIVSATGSVSGLVVNGVNVTPASIALPASIPFATTPVLSGQPLALAAGAPVTAGPFTAATAGSATLTLGASSGITAAVSGLDASGNVLVGPLTVQCNPPATDADLATVPIVAVTPPPTVPTVTKVAPSSGIAFSLVLISGTNLGHVREVDFGAGHQALALPITSRLIIALAPRETAGTKVDVTVRTNTGTSATSSADTFTFK